MPQRFRLAIIGTGLITQGSHLPAALASDRVEVAALVDSVAERAASLARGYGIAPKIATDVRDVLDDVDGALIATPNDSHAPIAIACLERGVPVLIEKPLASTSAEGERIVAAAAKTGAVVACGYSTRFRPSTVLLKDLVDRGYFGRARRFVHQFGTPGGWAPLSSYNLNRSTAGGGVMVVTATHFVDRMLDLFGMPDDVDFEDDASGGPEANCTAYFHYTRRGLEGMARYSKTTRLPSGMAIEFERGTVTLRDSDDAEIVFTPSDGTGYSQVIRTSPSPGAIPDSFLEQINDFIDAVRNKTRPRVTGEEGVMSLQLIERLYAKRRHFSEDWYGDERTPSIDSLAARIAA